MTASDAYDPKIHVRTVLWRLTGSSARPTKIKLSCKQKNVEQLAKIMAFGLQPLGIL